MADDIKTIYTFEAEYSGKKYDAGVKKSASLQKKHLLTTTKLTTALDKATRGVTKDIGEYDKASKKALAQSAALQAKVLDAREEDRDAIKASIDALEVYAEQMKEIQDASEEIRKGSRQRIVSETKEIKKARELLMVREAISEIERKQKGKREELFSSVAGFGGDEMREEMTDAIKDAFGSISGRDFGGLASGLFKAFGAAAKGAAGAGLRAGAGGGGGGALGGIAKAIGPMLNMVAKLGPLVMSLSSVLLAVVKMFLDADAAAKDFNKSVLDTSATAGFLKKNMGDSAIAAQDLADTMHDMYQQAISLDNLEWGISKETHSQIESAIFAQGVQIDKVSEYFNEVRRGRVESQGMVKDWGSMVQMSVGYSRAFGVSMTEVADLQGELMSELGMSFDDVQAGFQAMVEGADEAGVGANKFFGQMRAISSDLSLFNLRIGDAAKLMTQLDKAMSPRKAAEFFQTITKFFKGMGLMDRAKMVLMAGTGATKGILRKDLDQTEKALAAKLEQHGKGLGEDFKQAVGKKGQLVKFLAKHDKQLSGEEKDAIMSASRQEQKIARGGIIDLASALKDASPFAAMDEVEAMSKRMFGKPLEELTGVEVAAVEQAAGINDEQLDQFSKLKESLDVQKETIAQKIEDGSDLTEEESKMVNRLGITFKTGEKDKDAADQLRHKDSKAVWDNMDKSQQEMLRDSAGTLDQAKRQGDLTQSLVDKLGVIMDFLLGQLYDVLMSIWDGFTDLLAKMFAIDNEEKKLRKAQAQAAKSRDPEIQKAAQTAKNTKELAKNLKGTTIAANMRTALGPEADKKANELLKEVGKQKALMDDTSRSADDRAKAEQAWKKATADYNTVSMMQFKAHSKLQSEVLDASLENAGIFQGFGSSMGDTFEKAYKSMMTKPVWGANPDAKKLEANMKKAMEALKNGKTMGEAMKIAGLDDTQQKIFQQELLDQLDPAQYAKLLADYAPDYKDLIKENQTATGGGSGQQGASAKAGGPSAPPTAQTSTTATTTTPATTPATTTSTAQQAASPSSTKPVTPDDMKKQTDVQGQNMQDTIDGLRLAQKKQSSGIVFNGPYLKNQYGGQMEDSVYNAVSRALFEYYMYSDLDRDQAMKAIKAGINPRDVGASFLAAMKSAPSSLPIANEKDIRNMVIGGMKTNADGGLVTGHLPGNEMLASVAKGERIVPAGGGGGVTRVEIVLNDNAKRFIRAEAHNANVEANRRGKYR